MNGSRPWRSRAWWMLLAGFLAAGAVAACAGDPSTPPASAAVTPVIDSTPAGTASVAPDVTPVPTAAVASFPPAGASPAAVDPATEAELAALLAGVRDDVQPCEAIEAPVGAVAALGCRPGDALVRSVAIRLYRTPEAMLQAYQADLAAAGVALRTHQGRCEAGGAAEGAYVPGDNGAVLDPNRSACFRDEQGSAHYLATVDARILVDVMGTGPDPVPLQDWAWDGNRDQPGSPTVWRLANESGPSEDECVSANYDFTADARGPKGDPVAIARAAITGLKPGDIVELDAQMAGEAFVMVNRGRETIGNLYLRQDPEGGWLLERANMCAGLGVRMD